MTVPDYTPHFAVVGGPSPHPSGDGRVGVCLIASKAIKSVDLVEEAIEQPSWPRMFRDDAVFDPPVYKTTITVKIRNNASQQYVIIWADAYPEAWASLFELWGNDIQPDPIAELEDRGRLGLS